MEFGPIWRAMTRNKIGAILIALFVGWRMKPELIDSELSFSSSLMFTAWLWALRVVVPVAILAILISGLR